MNFRYFFLIAAILLSSVLSAQTDYFWIGGQGNWTNLNNWVTTSGLAPEEVPDANDNVIFDDNSFAQDNDTVFIFTKNPECKNMIRENLKYNVVLAGGADTTSLSIYGSLTFEEKISLATNYSPPNLSQEKQILTEMLQEVTITIQLKKFVV